MGTGAPAAADGRRAAAAMLRWRAHRLHQIAPRLAPAARVLPLLLHATFPARGLDREPPGVAGLRYRRGWGEVAQGFGLPPPRGAQRGPALVEAIFALPSRSGLDVLAIVRGGLSASDSGRVQERVEAAQGHLATAGAPLRVVLHDAARLAGDRETACRIIATGALLAGELSDAVWDALRVAAGPPVDPRLAVTLASRAPTPFAALALALLAGAQRPGPLDALRDLAAAGVPARALADPETFCARWSASPALDRARALASDPASGGPGQVLLAGRELALACAVALRRARGAERSTRPLWLEALGPGLPTVLLPALGQRLAALLPAVSLSPVRRGGVWEVRLPGGGILGRGARAAHARGRALALAAAALGALPGVDADEATARLGHLDEAWAALVPRLAVPRDAGALLVAVEAGPAQRSGPPYDLLNRGVERAVELYGALTVQLAPGRRITARRLPPEALIRALVAGGARVEIVAASPGARSAAARLSRVAALLRDPRATRPAVEVGGVVLVRDGRRLRSHPAARFALRPRAVTADPDAPDLAAPPRGVRFGRRSAVVHCRVASAISSAALLFVDGDGCQLRVPVPPAEVEERLDDSRHVLRGVASPAALALQFGEAADHPARPRARIAPIAVTVRGELPRLELQIGGERFGGTSPLGWRDAALALLAAWPEGEPRIALRDVQVTAAGEPVSAVVALWAASVCRRRLHTFIRMTLATYRIAATGR